MIFFAKMFKFLFILVSCVLVQIKAQTEGEAWVTRARVLNAQEYFTDVMQEFVYEVERRGWSNLKMVDIEQNVNMLIANWNVSGTVHYTNGFVTRIQKIDLSDISSSFSRRVEDDVLHPTATVTGYLTFRNINIGYDVLADIVGVGQRKYTGEILSNSVTWLFRISKDVLTEEITATATDWGLSGAFIRMIYMPDDHLTEVLSRNFAPGNNAAGISSWRNTFAEIVTDIVKHKVDFPLICFNC